MMKKLQVSDKDIVVIGTGLETAEYFTGMGNRVTMVEMQDKVGPGLYVQHYFDLYPKLYEKIAYRCEMWGLEPSLNQEKVNAHDRDAFIFYRFDTIACKLPRNWS